MFVLFTATCAAVLTTGWVEISPAPRAADLPPIDPLGRFLDVADPPIPELNRAFGLFQNDGPTDAERHLHRFIREYPDLPPAPLIIAQFAIREHWARVFRKWIERTVEDFPDEPEAYSILGAVNLRQGRFTEAELLFQKSAEKLEGFSGSANRKRRIQMQIQRGLATVAEARWDFPAARKHLEAVLAQDHKDAAALQQLGRLLFADDKPDEAIVKLKEAAALDKRLLPPEATLALLYDGIGHPDEARKWMTAALAKRPRDLRLHLVAARWWLEVEEFGEARKQADAALALVPKSLDAMNLRGVIALFEKDYKTAVEQFRKVLEVSPHDFAAANNLALALIHGPGTKGRRQALIDARGLARNYPDKAEAQATLGYVLAKSGRWDEAEAVLRKAVTPPVGSLTSDRAYYFALVLAERKQFKHAQMLVSRALELKRPFLMRPEAESLLKELDRQREDARRDGSDLER